MRYRPRRMANAPGQGCEWANASWVWHGSNLCRQSRKPLGKVVKTRYVYGFRRFTIRLSHASRRVRMSGSRANDSDNLASISPGWHGDGIGGVSIGVLLEGGSLARYYGRVQHAGNWLKLINSSALMNRV